MRKISIIAFLFCVTLTNVFGQTFSDCQRPDQIFVRAEQAATFDGSLQEYFENELKGMFQDFDGTIRLEILIDTTGKACCTSVSNNLSSVPSIKIKDVINNMAHWAPAKQNNYIVNFFAILEVSFNHSTLSVNYVNEKAPIPHPIVNTNASNNPEIVKDRKTKAVWKLWNFSNSMMPANLSRSVAMDGNGVIWCCTDYGLVRIAGDDHWQVFNGMNVQALAGKNNITWTTGMAVDKANNVWVQSFDYFLKYDGKQWTRFDTTNSPLKLVQKICVDNDGIVWFCTFRGLIKYDGKEWTKFDTHNSKLVSDNVREVFVGKNGTIWIATDKGINKVINGEWSLLDHRNTNMPEDDVTSLKGDSLGNIWAGVGTKDKNYLVKIDTSNNITVFPSGVIWNITIDEKAGKIWLATNGQGLVSFDGKTFTHFDKSNSIIPTTIVSDVLIDNNGNKWVSTFGGLVFTDKK